MKMNTGAEVSPEVQKMRDEKNEEIKVLEVELTDLKLTAENMNLKIDNFDEKNVILEKQKDVEVDIEKKYRVYKTNKELLTEINKLEGQDVNMLEQEIVDY